jgi:hypothetical protein
MFRLKIVRGMLRHYKRPSGLSKFGNHGREKPCTSSYWWKLLNWTEQWHVVGWKEIETRMLSIYANSARSLCVNIHASRGDIHLKNTVYYAHRNCTSHRIFLNYYNKGVIFILLLIYFNQMHFDKKSQYRFYPGISNVYIPVL